MINSSPGGWEDGQSLQAMLLAEVRHEHYLLLWWGTGYSGRDPGKHSNKLFIWSTDKYLCSLRISRNVSQLPRLKFRKLMAWYICSSNFVQKKKRDPELPGNHPNTSLRQVGSNIFIYLLDASLIIFHRLDSTVNPKIFLLFPHPHSLHIICWGLLLSWKKFFAPKGPARNSDPVDSAAFSTSQVSAILWESEKCL